MTTWIERTARQKSIGQMVLFLLVTAIVIMLFMADAAYWKAFFHGPRQVGTVELNAASKASDDFQPIATPIVKVTGDKVITTGVQEVTTYEGVISRVSAGYYALRVGGRILIVKSAEAVDTTVTGSLDPMPYDLKTQLFPQGTDPAVEKQVYPLLLDTDYRESSVIWILWALLAEAVFGFFAWRSWGRLTGRTEHPAVTRAKAWGSLVTTSTEVERELKSGAKTKSKGWTVTQNYAVKRKLFSFDLFRMENLIWAYKKVVKRSVNFIPIGKGYAAALNFSDGEAVIDGRRKRVDELLAFAENRAPWIVHGYSDEMQQAYSKSKDELIAEVLKRKREMGR